MPQIINLERRNLGVQIVQQVKSRWTEKELERFEKDKPVLYKAVIDTYGYDLSNVYFMRALELIEALGESYYCFLHGQSFSQYVSLLYTTKKVELADPSLAAKYRKFFRYPEKVVLAPRNVQELIQRHPNIRDSELQEELLSVSGYPLARQGYESAFFFFRNNFSFNGHTSFETIMAQSGMSPTIGALQLIAIPKEFVESEELSGVYNSYPGGQPTGKSVDLLKRFQKLENVEGKQDQYRLLTSMLTFNPEVITVSLTELNKSEKKRLYKQVQQLI